MSHMLCTITQTSEIKSIEERGRQATDALITAFRRRAFLRSAEQKSAEQMEIEKLRHELIISERDAAYAQRVRAAAFCQGKGSGSRAPRSYDE
eukprot:6205776-Amphidinium_carterae.1